MCVGNSSRHSPSLSRSDLAANVGTASNSGFLIAHQSGLLYGISITDADS